MKTRNTKNTRSASLTYQMLEPRQVLTSIVFGGYALSHHVPQDSSVTVISNLTEAPEISQQPEFGQLDFDQENGTLTYQPNGGFTGSDSFELAEQGSTESVEHSVRVWESVYAVQDWALVRPGQSSTIDVLANDYSFQQNKPAGENVVGRYGGWSNNSFHWQQDSATFEIVEVSGELSGSVSISGDGQTLVYESGSDFTAFSAI